MNIFMRTLLTTCLFLAALPLQSTWGGTFLTSEDNTSILSVPVKGDLYIAGRKIVVEQTVQGDVAAAGGVLIINGNVEQDLLAAGGSIIVNGRVGDDIRAAGGNITIFSVVGGDLIAFGGSVTITGKTIVEGDLIAAGGHIILDGTVKGDVRIAGGEVVLNGKVLGNAVIHAGDQLKLNGEIQGDTIFTTEAVTVAPSASFRGDVEYWTRNGAMDFPDGAVAGEALFKTDLKPRSKVPSEIKFDRKHAAGLLVWWSILTFMTGAVTIFALLLLPKRWYTLAVGSLRDGFWGNLGLGLLYFILSPVVTLILMATVIGIPLGLFLFFLFLFSVVFSKAISAIVLARWLERRRFAQWGKAALYFLSLAIFALLKLLTFVPVLGWVGLLVLICAVYGSILNAAWTTNRDTI